MSTRWQFDQESRNFLSSKKRLSVPNNFRLIMIQMFKVLSICIQRRIEHFGKLVSSFSHNRNCVGHFARWPSRNLSCRTESAAVTLRRKKKCHILKCGEDLSEDLSRPFASQF